MVPYYDTSGSHTYSTSTADDYCQHCGRGTTAYAVVYPGTPWVEPVAIPRSWRWYDRFREWPRARVLHPKTVPAQRRRRVIHQHVSATEQRKQKRRARLQRERVCPLTFRRIV